jgi:hypothetical protein
VIRLRQIALVAHDLDAVVSELGSSLGLRVAYNDPGVATFGLRNAVLPVGTQFIEVVSPTREETAAGRQLERMGGDGGYMVITHTDDPAPYRKRAEGLGIRTALEAEDHDYLIWQLHPGDTGGSFLEIDYQPGGEDPNGPWMPAGPDWQRAVNTEIVMGITAVDIEVADPEVVAARWSEILGLAVNDGCISVDNATIRFVEGARGLAAVDLHAADHAVAGQTMMIGGVHFRV